MIGGKVLVTGSSGLIGRAVFARLNALGEDVTGVSRRNQSPGVIRADLTDGASAAAVVKTVSPRSVVPSSRSCYRAWEELRANVVATRNLLEAVAKLDPAPAVIVAGSAAEYGDPIADRVAEDHPTRPVTEYGRTKVQQSTVVQKSPGPPACASASFDRSTSSRANCQPRSRSGTSAVSCWQGVGRCEQFGAVALTSSATSSR